MRTYVVALLAVACLGLSACGSDDATHDVVPSSLPELTPPPGSEALAHTTSTDQTNTTSTDQTQTQGQAPAGTATGTTTTPPAQTGTGGTGTGTTGGTGGTGTSTSGGTGGVSPGEFSQFCKDNPGAC
jgi:hypothetical protein